MLTSKYVYSRFDYLNVKIYNCVSNLENVNSGNYHNRLKLKAHLESKQASLVCSRYRNGH